MNDPRDDEPDLEDIKEKYWGTYLLRCRAEGVPPSLKDFDTWYQEQPEYEDE